MNERRDMLLDLLAKKALEGLDENEQRPAQRP
jgi:hypothetical protein